MADTKQRKISTFANKTREMRLSMELCASQYMASSSVLKKVMARCGDLPMLASELDLPAEEMQELERMHTEVTKEAVELLSVIDVCRQRLEALSGRVERDYADYCSREATKPLAGIYQASAQTLAKKVARRHLAASKHKE